MKVLVVSHNSFSQTHNNGRTLSAIFSAFDRCELCQLFFTPRGIPDHDRCENYYQITDKDALYSILFRRRCGSNMVSSFKKSFIGQKGLKTSTHLRLLRSMIWFFSSWYNGGLNKWLVEQKPNLIFYVGGDSIFSHKIAVLLSKRLCIPLVAYFTDDYIINTPSTFYNKILCYYYKQTIKQSLLLFAIGKEMAICYSDFFHREFFPIMNIVDVPKEQPLYIPNEKEFKINYFGGLHLGRELEILRFGRIVKYKISPQINKNITISIYTFSSLPDDIKVLYKDMGISVYQGLSGEDLKLAMSKTDIFLHVESKDPHYKALTRLSVSTKIPEYMGMAKPIISFGPSDVASFKVIAEANDSLVLDDPDTEIEETILNKIVRCLNDENKLSKIAYDNYCYASKHFNKEIVSKQFKNELLKVLSNR